jgi:hypothetical protein
VKIVIICDIQANVTRLEGLPVVLPRLCDSEQSRKFQSIKTGRPNPAGLLPVMAPKITGCCSLLPPEPTRQNCGQSKMSLAVGGKQR